MSDERVANSEIVTKFLLNTCRPRPQPDEHETIGALACASLACPCIPHKEEGDRIPLTIATGNVAELYIEPLLPHFGDIDVMVHHCAGNNTVSGRV